MLLCLFYPGQSVFADVFALHDRLFSLVSPGKACYIEPVDSDSLRVWGPLDREYGNHEFIAGYYDRTRTSDQGWTGNRTDTFFYCFSPARNLLFRLSNPADPRGGWNMDLLCRICLAQDWSVLSSVSLGPRFTSGATAGRRDSAWRGMTDLPFFWTPVQLEYVTKGLFFHYDVRVKVRPFSLVQTLVLRTSPAWSSMDVGCGLEWAAGRP
jgi:hypothetical protein